MALDPSGRGLLRDLGTAARAASSLNDAALAAGEPASLLGIEVYYSLCEVSLRSRVYNVTPIVLNRSAVVQ
jgi:hypothetical protein